MDYYTKQRLEELKGESQYIKWCFGIPNPNFNLICYLLYKVFYYPKMIKRLEEEQAAMLEMTKRYGERYKAAKNEGLKPDLIAADFEQFIKNNNYSEEYRARIIILKGSYNYYEYFQ